MTILVVDDSLTIRHFLKLILLELFPECSVVEAVDGKDALHRMTENKIDLIITDLEMGNHDGEDFLKKILSNKILKNKKIIIFSSQQDFLIKFDIPLNENISFIDKATAPNAIKKQIKEFYDGIEKS